MAKIGGARPGAGRPRGSVSKRSVELLAGATASGITPVEYMLQILRDEAADPARREWAAEKAAPYLHPRPAPLERTVAIDLPSTSTVDGVGAALDEIIRSVAAGEMSPGDGQSMVALIEARRRAIETSELSSRISALEGRINP